MVFDRAATTAGATASRLATTSTPSPKAAITSTGTMEIGHGAQVGGKRPPHRLTGGDAQWYADHDPHQGNRARLPADRGADLRLDEPERLQKADLMAASGHADHQQVQERRHAEQRQHEAQDEREVHRFPEVDERGGGIRQLGDAGVGPEVVGDVGPSHCTRRRVHCDDELLVGAVRRADTRSVSVRADRGRAGSRRR